MEQEDEDVIFTNSPLYDHLVSSGHEEFESASCLDDILDQSSDHTAQPYEIVNVAWLREHALAATDRLGLRSSPLLLPDALDTLLASGLMMDRDRAMVTDLCSELRRPTWGISDPVVAAMLVVGVASALYLPASCIVLSVALVLCAGGAGVARLRAAAGRRCVADFCGVAASLSGTGLKCVRLLQESHLMARGVSL